MNKIDTIKVPKPLPRPAKAADVAKVLSFLTQHLGKPIPSPSLLDQRGQQFRRAVQSFAEANQIPVITFANRKDKSRPGVLADSPWPERKIDKVMPLMRRAAATGRSQVVAIGVAQEFQRVFTGAKSATETGAVWFSYNRVERRVNSYYFFYVWDVDFGPAFIKICAHFPYPSKLWFNGHEWAKHQAIKAGLAFTELSNGFASCEDPAALQDICDRLGPGTITVFAERWWARLPLPFSAADRHAGYWWDISISAHGKRIPSISNNPPCPRSSARGHRFQGQGAAEPDHHHGVVSALSQR